MKAPKVYAYSKCSTCKKALRWLDERGVEREEKDIVTSPPTRAELERALELSGLPISKLFNTSGVSYREGKWGERLKSANKSLLKSSNESRLPSAKLSVWSERLRKRHAR